MIKSLRWRLQAWYALLLVVVLVLFTSSASWLSWQLRLKEVDADLDSMCESWLGFLPQFPMPGPGGRPGSGFPGGPFNPDQRPPERERRDAFNDERGPRDRPPEDRRPLEIVLADDNPNGPPPPPLAESLNQDPRPEPTRPRWRGPRRPWPRPSKEFMDHFTGLEDERFDYIIWDNQGHLRSKSEAAVETEFLHLERQQDERLARVARTRGNRREVIQRSHGGAHVLVSTSLTAKWHQTLQDIGLLAAIGVGVLAIGLIGGYWSTARALRPIQRMTQTAAMISHQNLSQRIDRDQTDDELSQLAGVLNDTFGRLQAAFDRQSQFTADASHELRTPVSVVLSQTELTLSRDRDAPEYRKALEVCGRAAKRMQGLVESLLKLARLDGGMEPISRVPVELRSLVQECVDLAQPLAEQRGIRLEIAPDSTATTVAGDHNQLVQVVLNLLTNAIRYNRDHGTVTLAVRSVGREGLLTVTDCGVGIAAEHLPHLFDRFYRVDPARARVEGGNGLGLAIALSIVRAHEGTLAVESVVDQGTTVTMRLPLT